MLLADDAKVLARAVSALRAEADSLREALDEKSEQLRRVGQSRQIFSGIEDVPSNGALLALGGKAAPRTHGSGDVRSINVDANSLPAKFDVAELEALVEAVNRVGAGQWTALEPNFEGRTARALAEKWRGLRRTGRVQYNTRTGKFYFNVLPANRGKARPKGLEAKPRRERAGGERRQGDR